MKDNFLGIFIKNKRDELDMSLREFGKMCDISHTTIDCIEKGYDPRTGKEINITNNTFSKLSKALNVPLSKLVELSQDIQGQPTPVSESGIEESREQFMKAAEEMKKAVEKINSGIIPKTDFQIIKTTCPIDGTEQVIYQVFYIVDGNRFPMPNNGCENYHLCDQCDKCRSDTMVIVMK